MEQLCVFRVYLGFTKNLKTDILLFFNYLNTNNIKFQCPKK